MFGKKSEFKFRSMHICVFSAKTFLRKKSVSRICQNRSIKHFYIKNNFDITLIYRNLFIGLYHGTQSTLDKA